MTDKANYFRKRLAGLEVGQNVTISANNRILHLRLMWAEPGKVKCRGCGVFFTPGHGNQRYHDAQCRGRES